MRFPWTHILKLYKPKENPTLQACSDSSDQELWLSVNIMFYPAEVIHEELLLMLLLQFIQASSLWKRS